MSQPGSARQASAVAVVLLKRTLPGPSGTIRAECQRTATVAAVIWRRWRVGPWQWQCKHVRWFLEHHTRSYRPWTRYRYWLTVERLLQLIGKHDEWRMQFNGPWRSPKCLAQHSATHRSAMRR